MEIWFRSTKWNSSCLTRAAKKLIQEERKEGNVISLSGTKAKNAVILLTSGRVILTNTTPDTLEKRLGGQPETEKEE